MSENLHENSYLEKEKEENLAELRKTEPSVNIRGMS